MVLFMDGWTFSFNHHTLFNCVAEVVLFKGGRFSFNSKYVNEGLYTWIIIGHLRQLCSYYCLAYYVSISMQHSIKTCGMMPIFVTSCPAHMLENTRWRRICMIDEIVKSKIYLYFAIYIIYLSTFQCDVIFFAWC